MAQQLIVEGKDDAIAIANLLKKRGVPPPIGYTNPRKFIDEFVLSAGGYDKSLTALKEAIENPDLSRIGLVVDANNDGPQAKWKAISNILSTVFFPDFLVNYQPGTNGGVLHVDDDTLPIVGIWIMPDNVQNGYLEHFLATLIPSDNLLWPRVNNVVDQLEKEGICSYSPVKSQKARMHTWLAWQKEPGVPFGLAIEAGYLDAGSTFADAFEVWFRETFELS